MKVVMKVKYSHARKVVKEAKSVQQERWKTHTHVEQSTSCPPFNPRIQHDPQMQGAWGRIHDSHRQSVIRNLVFCRNCGYTYSQRCAKLQEPCNGRFVHKDTIGRLIRMKKGLHPISTKVFWPDGAPTFLRQKVENLG